MGRRVKTRQPAPPSLDEFLAEKDGKKRSKSSQSSKPAKRAKSSDNNEKPSKRAKAKAKALKNVDIEQEKKSLFENSDDEQIGSGSDLEPEEENDEFFDSDEENVGNGPKQMFSDDDEDEEVLEKMNTEAVDNYGFGSSEDEEESEDEDDEENALGIDLDAAVEVPRPKVLPSEQERVEEEKAGIVGADPTALRTRILEVVKVLDDFATLAEDGRSRSEYTQQLVDDIAKYYGYSPYLAEKLFNLFSPAEAVEFFEANEIHRPVTIRTNTLKTSRRDLAQALVNRGVNLQPIGKWTKVGLQVFDSQVPIGATPEYLAGHYILQAASSFLPVMALGPQENERILDMASAPGGKTTFISAMMKNTGCVFANDSNKSRAKSLIANIHRLGCTNTIVCHYDAREFPKVIGGFDRVLLDAPCSGTGVIAKDPAVKTNRTEKDFIQLPHLQKQLLLSAIDSVDASSKTGGVIVYSTCSVMVEENEAVVNYVLRKRPNVKLVETELEIGKPGFTSFRGKTFDPSVSLTRRYYPHAYNVDGFYVAKFKKIASGVDDKSSAGAREKERMMREDSESDYHIINDDFAAFDETEDKELIDKARRRAMRKKGLNPKADKSKASTK